METTWSSDIYEIVDVRGRSTFKFKKCVDQHIPTKNCKWRPPYRILLLIAHYFSCIFGLKLSSFSMTYN